MSAPERDRGPDGEPDAELTVVQSSQPATATGHCACGAVSYRVTGPLRQVYDCHCHRCRRITGHYLAATAAHPDDVRLGGTDNLRWWGPDDESVAYGFCARCGSTLFWRPRSDPNRFVIAAGSLDGPTGLRTVKAWWCSEAGDYYERPAGVEEYGRDG